ARGFVRKIRAIRARSGCAAGQVARRAHARALCGRRIGRWRFPLCSPGDDVRMTRSRPLALQRRPRAHLDRLALLGTLRATTLAASPAVTRATRLTADAWFHRREVLMQRLQSRSAPAHWHPAVRALVESAARECPNGHAQALQALTALALQKAPARGVFDP